VARKAKKKIEKILLRGKKKEAPALYAINFPRKRIIREVKTKKDGV